MLCRCASLRLSDEPYCAIAGRGIANPRNTNALPCRSMLSLDIPLPTLFTAVRLPRRPIPVAVRRRARHMLAPPIVAVTNPCGDAPTSAFAAPPREAVCLPHGVYGCKKKRTKNRRTQDAGKTPNQATNELHATLYFANHSAHRAHETCGDVRRRRELYHTGRGGVNGACATGARPVRHMFSSSSSPSTVSLW